MCDSCMYSCNRPWIIKKRFSIGQGSAMMFGLEPATEDMPAIADLLLRPQFIFMLLSRLVGFWARRMLA